MISANQTSVRARQEAAHAHPTSETSPAPRLHVPLSDLKAQNKRIATEVMAAISEVIDNSSFILGPKVVEFETEFARYSGAKHCIGVNSGTSALHLALICAGVGHGDEVITVPMTFIATSWAISYCGATPVYVDIDPATYTMDPRLVERAITKKTKALLPVHLYGQPADLAQLKDIATRHGIALIEDCAQSHGAMYQGQHAGTVGMAGCFSFYPGKNLGAFGEGGAVITNDDAIAKRMRALRDHAQAERYHHSEIGFNYRMDGIQGAVLAIKMQHIRQWTDARIALADRYRALLVDLPINLPVQSADRKHVWHQFVVTHPNRDEIRRQLEARGIHTGLHYPIPLHLQQAYAHLGGRAGDHPVSERIGAHCLTLPLFAEMTASQQSAVVDALNEVLN